MTQKSIQHSGERLRGLVAQSPRLGHSAEALEKYLSDQSIRNEPRAKRWYFTCNCTQEASGPHGGEESGGEEKHYEL